MIRALSLRQPWLWAVTDLGKPIENRRWYTAHRGPFWLHAAKGCTRIECKEALVWMHDVGVLTGAQESAIHELIRLPSTWPGFDNLERGGVCGYAELVDVIEPIRMWGPHLLRRKATERGIGPQALEKCAGDLLAWERPNDVAYVEAAVQVLGVSVSREDLRWWMPEQYGFVLRAVRKFPRVDCRGMLNFFRIPPEIEEVAERAIMGKCPCESRLVAIGPGHLPSCPFSNPDHGIAT